MPALAPPLRSPQPCLRNGASLGKEAVLAASGRAGDIAAGVGRESSWFFLLPAGVIFYVPQCDGGSVPFGTRDGLSPAIAQGTAHAIMRNPF